MVRNKIFASLSQYFFGLAGTFLLVNLVTFLIIDRTRPGLYELALFGMGVGSLVIGYYIGRGEIRPRDPDLETYQAVMLLIASILAMVASVIMLFVRASG